MAMRMLRCFLFTWLICFAGTLTVRAQVIIIPEVQASGVVMKQQLWSVMISNLSGTARQGTLTVSVTDLQASQPLMEATSSLISLPAGTRRVTFRDLYPVTYAFAAVGFSADRQLSQPLPVGEYTVCYRLMDNTNKPEVLATECVKILAEPLSPPQLILPEPAAVLLDKRPILTWTPPAPVYVFNNLSYSIIVSQVLDKQSPEEAIQRNIPVMTTFSTTTSVPYTASFTNLEPGKLYAWQVSALDGNRFGGKSEVWTFSVMPDSVRQIISSATYIKLEQQSTTLSIVHQGILKMEYMNRYADSTVRLMISRENDRRKPFVIDMKVNPGQNLLEYNLNGKLKLDEASRYQVEVINSRKEVWRMRFNARKYF